MAIEVYWGSGSPFAWRVLLTLEVKQVPYESRLLEFSKDQHRTPEFLALNPRGKVPVLRDGDLAVYESQAIMRHLDRRFPDPPLFGRSLEEQARVDMALAELASYVEPAGIDLVRPIFFGRAAQEGDRVRAAAESIHRELRTHEERLGTRDWLVGHGLTAADLALYPMVQIVLRAAAKEAADPFELGLLPFEAGYPRLAAWSRRVEALPGYERTYPPHWRAGSL